LGGAWNFVSEGLSPPNPHVVTGLCGKTSACFLMQLTRKSSLLRLRDMSSLQDMSNVLFKHDRAQSAQRI